MPFTSQATEDAASQHANELQKERRRNAALEQVEKFNRGGLDGAVIEADDLPDVDDEETWDELFVCPGLVGIDDAEDPEDPGVDANFYDMASHVYGDAVAAGQASW